MRDKRVYYICVTPFFPSPGNWRGAYVLDQVKAIQRNSDFEVLVFVGGGNENDDYIIDGVNVYRYKTRGLPSNVLNGIFNRYNAQSFVKRVLSQSINPEDIAFVHCHVSMRAACGLALKKLNPDIKVLLQHHDLDPFNLRSGVIGRNNRFNIRYRAQKAIQLYNKVDLHVCISQACRNTLLQFPNARYEEIFKDCKRCLSLCKGLPSIRPKKTYVLYNGVDCRMFNKGKESLKIREVNSIIKIGCIANFQELKDHITLIKAFEILHKRGFDNIRLSLLGSGETKEMCVFYLKEHGLYQFVEWPDEVTHDKLPDYYHSLDLFVLPSFFEGFGCVFTEAAACGVPFMGCINQGYSEYISEEDQNKWLVEPGDYERLADIIEAYIKYRYPQTLKETYDIDSLTSNFLKYLEML